MFLHDLTVDGQPLDLGPPTAWRRVTDRVGRSIPTSNDAGDLGMSMNTTGSQPPVMLHGWVPDPVPALVTTDEDDQFTAPGLETPTHDDRRRTTAARAGVAARGPGR